MIGRKWRCKMVFRKEHMIVAVFLTILSSVMAMLADPVCYGTDDIFAAIFITASCAIFFGVKSS